jgi:hypothetical protein
MTRNLVNYHINNTYEADLVGHMLEVAGHQHIMRGKRITSDHLTIQIQGRDGITLIATEMVDRCVEVLTNKVKLAKQMSVIRHSKKCLVGNELKQTFRRKRRSEIFATNDKRTKKQKKRIPDRDRRENSIQETTERSRSELTGSSILSGMRNATM